jgi:hypothetical protein
LNTTPLDLAHTWLEIFFNSDDPDEFKKIMAPDCSFTGPLARFDSAKSYISSLKSSPPVDCRYELIASFGNSTSALVLYRFIKPGIDTHMAQYFCVSRKKIVAIRLIFNAEELS